MKINARAARKGVTTRLPPAAVKLPSKSPGSIPQKDLPATVKHFLVHGQCEVKETRNRQQTDLQLIILADSSASMAADRQISMVKGLISTMLQRYHHRQPQVCIIALSQGTAGTIVPFTRNRHQVETALAAVRTGGKTNLAAGFEQVLQQTGRQQGRAEQQLYLFTDGRINAGYTPQPLQEAVAFFRTKLRHLQQHTYIINTETGIPRLGMAVTLAQSLGCRMFEPGQ